MLAQFAANADALGHVPFAGPRHTVTVNARGCAWPLVAPTRMDPVWFTTRAVGSVLVVPSGPRM